MVDEFLQKLVRSARGTDGGLAVTLNVKGTLVSGWMVGEETYAIGMALRLDNLSSEDSEEATNPQDDTLHMFKILMDYESEDESNPLYIHIRNPTIYQSGVRYGMTGLWWRGTLESVDGFQFGRVSEDD